MAAFSCNECGKGFDFGDCGCDGKPDAPPTAEQRLADVFVAELTRCLTHLEFEQMQIRNALEKDPLVCHSHDFCDANMVMVAAGLRLGVDLSECTDYDINLINSAWQLAAPQLRLQA